MKNLLFTLFLFVSLFSYSQNIDDAFGQRSSGGTTARLNAISPSSKLGLITYNTDLAAIVYWNGSAYQTISGFSGDATEIADGSVSNAEFENLDGVTSPIQEQIDNTVKLTGNQSDISGEKQWISSHQFRNGIGVNAYFSYVDFDLPTYTDGSIFSLITPSDYSGIELHANAGGNASDAKIKFFPVHSSTFTGNPNNLIAEIFGRVSIGDAINSSEAVNKGQLDAAIAGVGGGTDDQNADEVPFTPTANVPENNVQEAIEALGDNQLLGETVITTSKALEITDADGYLSVDSASNVTLTIPPNASVPFLIGTVINADQDDDGDIIIALGSGVTLFLGGTSLTDFKTFNRGHSVSLLKIGTDVWKVKGKYENALVTNAEYTALSASMKAIESIYYNFSD